MKTIALIAAAGLAGAASAQTVSLDLTHDDVDSVINVGESVTWTLSVSYTGFGGTPVAAGGNMLIAGDNSLGTTSNMAYTPTNGGNNGGTSNGAGIGFVNWTNSLFIAAFDPTKPVDPSNPFVVGTFTFTASAAGILDHNILKGQAASAFLTIGTSAFGGDVNFEIGNPGLTVNTQALEIVPTPASAALLGLGGLVALRRRR